MTRRMIGLALVTALFCLPVMSFAVNDGSSATSTSPPHSNSNSSNSNSSSSSWKELKKVVVVGGTHGNEYTGVWCIKALDRALDRIHSTYPSLVVSTLLGNPKAHLENKRFVDEDLNRQFTREALLLANNYKYMDADTTTMGSDSHMDMNTDTDTRPHELVRALEIDQHLGPKFGTTSHEQEEDGSIGTVASTHVVIDLHSTTSNMGLTIIVAEGDAIMTRAAAYVRQKCIEAGHVVHCILHTHANRDVRPNLSSTGRHGFTIEVGPVPQGVLRHDAVEKTESAIHALFEYLHLHNTDRSLLQEELERVYARGSGASGGQEVGFGRVPCFRSAKAKNKGEMSSKIQWPSASDNPNFPALMVHKQLQDQDFTLIETGDALFVDLDGNVIPYDGSHGSPIYLMFVNEGGYYYASSGTGISVAVKAEYDLESGMLIEEEEEEEGSVQVNTKEYAFTGAGGEASDQEL